MDKPDNIIFVFGSNTEGRHGAGAAKHARLNYGAIYGQAKGLQGNSYAIITKDLQKGKRSIDLQYIEKQVNELKTYAANNPNLTFKVTAIGCNLAGYTYEEIGPMFLNSPLNMILPKEFINAIIQKPHKYDT